MSVGAIFNVSTASGVVCEPSQLNRAFFADVFDTLISPRGYLF